MLRRILDLELPGPGLFEASTAGLKTVGEVECWATALRRLRRWIGQVPLHRRTDGGRAFTLGEKMVFLSGPQSSRVPGQTSTTNLPALLQEWEGWIGARRESIKKGCNAHADDARGTVLGSFENSKIRLKRFASRQDALLALELYGAFCTTAPPVLLQGDEGFVDTSPPGIARSSFAWVGETAWPTEWMLQHLPMRGPLEIYQESCDGLRELQALDLREGMEIPEPLYGEAQIYQVDREGEETWWLFPDDMSALGELVRRALQAGAALQLEGQHDWGFESQGVNVGVLLPYPTPDWDDFWGP